MDKLRKPSEVLKIEDLRKAPFCSTFGCAENEQLAKAVVRFLAETDSWKTPLDMDQVREQLDGDWDWCTDHGHGGTGKCHKFFETWVHNGVVTEDFVKRVARSWDWQEFRDEVLDVFFLKVPE